MFSIHTNSGSLFCMNEYKPEQLGLVLYWQSVDVVLTIEEYAQVHLQIFRHATVCDTCNMSIIDDSSVLWPASSRAIEPHSTLVMRTIPVQREEIFTLFIYKIDEYTWYNHISLGREYVLILFTAMAFYPKTVLIEVWIKTEVQILLWSLFRYLNFNFRHANYCELSSVLCTHRAGSHPPAVDVSFARPCSLKNRIRIHASWWRSPLRCRTSIIWSSTLVTVRAPSSWSILRTHACQRSSSMTRFCFAIFSRAFPSTLWSKERNRE